VPLRNLTTMREKIRALDKAIKALTAERQGG
jgi:chorismate mutase